MHKQDEDFAKCMKDMQNNMEAFTKIMSNSMQMMTSMMLMNQQNIHNPGFHTTTHMNQFSPPQTPNIVHPFFTNEPTTSASRMSQQQEVDKLKTFTDL